jgi:hypothetical protein
VGRTFLTYLYLLSLCYVGHVVEDACRLTVSSGVPGREVSVVMANDARNEDPGQLTDC